MSSSEKDIIMLLVQLHLNLLSSEEVSRRVESLGYTIEGLTT